MSELTQTSLTTKQVAALLQVSEKSVWSLHDRETLIGEKVGRDLFFTREKVKEEIRRRIRKGIRVSEDALRLIGTATVPAIS